MNKVDLMRELIALIKEINELGNWKMNQGRTLERIHARWLALLPESPQYKRNLNPSLTFELREYIEVSATSLRWDMGKKYIAVRFEKAKSNLILLITDHIRNPD